MMKSAAHPSRVVEGGKKCSRAKLSDAAGFQPLFNSTDNISHHSSGVGHGLNGPDGGGINLDEQSERVSDK